MDELAVTSAGPVIDPQPPQAAHAAPLATWLREGLRSGLLLRPRIAGTPTPAQVLALLVATNLLWLGLSRLEIPGGAYFHAAGWLGTWWTTGVTVLLVWTLLWRRPAAVGGEASPGLAAWFALWIVGYVPVGIVAEALAILRGHEWLPAALVEMPVFNWGVWLFLSAWLIAVPAVLACRFGMGAARVVVLVVGLVAMEWVLLTYTYARPWYPDGSDEEDDVPRLSLSQETFERQQALWRKAVEGLAPERPGVRDVYGLVFAPYAREDVFLRESTMVAGVLAERFDAQGRVLHLANHATTTDSLPWATPLNLRRAVEALARRMDREHDLLVVYLTSHGASNFRLSAQHWPLEVESLAPMDLQRALDEAGIRHRVIAISACYSGGWVGPLAGEHSLVMTAAAADKTSYGCGRRSELTYFGRALFDEQLRGTHSFEQAFAAAVPLIREREEAAGKPDGFSDPQISVGGGIRPVLRELEQRLDGAARP